MKTDIHHDGIEVRIVSVDQLGVRHGSGRRSVDLRGEIREECETLFVRQRPIWAKVHGDQV